jgi:hypothetical protein
MADIPPSNDLKLEYLQMQQEADFALWRAREANGEAKRAYARHLAGEGDAPSANELDAIAQLEKDAEEKYRALRQFVRGFFGS